MASYKQSTAYERHFLMVDSSDSKTGKASATVTVTICKTGGSFGAAAGAVAELANGFYKISLTTADTDTAGDLSFHCTASGADATDFVDQVTSTDLAAIKSDTAAVKVQTDKLAFSVTNQVDANVIDWKGATAPAMTGDAYARLGAPAGASVSADIAAVKAVDDAIKAKTDNLPTDPADESLIIAATDGIMTRLGAPAGASVSADVAAIKAVDDAIKAKTDNLPASPAAVGDIPTAAAITNAVLDEATASHQTAGSVGKAIGAAGGGLDAAGVRSAIGMASANLDTQLSGIDSKTTNLPSDPADESLIIAATDAIMNRLGAPAGASVSADVAAVKAVDDAVKLKTDQLAFTVAGQVDANALAINGDATAAANLAKTTRAIARGTVGAGATTSLIPTSAFAPAGGAEDQFKGAIITFDADTTTPALRSQKTDITASTNAAAPELTVTPLTTAPAAGDTFSVT